MNDNYKEIGTAGLVYSVPNDPDKMPVFAEPDGKGGLVLHPAWIRDMSHPSVPESEREARFALCADMKPEFAEQIAAGDYKAQYTTRASEGVTKAFSESQAALRGYEAWLQDVAQDPYQWRKVRDKETGYEFMAANVSENLIPDREQAGKWSDILGAKMSMAEQIPEIALAGIGDDGMPKPNLYDEFDFGTWVVYGSSKAEFDKSCEVIPKTAMEQLRDRNAHDAYVSAREECGLAPQDGYSL